MTQCRERGICKTSDIWIVRSPSLQLVTRSTAGKNIFFLRSHIPNHEELTLKPQGRDPVILARGMLLKYKRNRLGSCWISRSYNGKCGTNCSVSLSKWLNHTSETVFIAVTQCFWVVCLVVAEINNVIWSDEKTSANPWTLFWSQQALGTSWSRNSRGWFMRISSWRR